MFETIDKIFMAGLGAMSMTKEKAEQIFDEYVKRGQAEQAARTGVVKEMMDTAEKTRKDLEKLVKEQVQASVSKLHLATQDDLHRIEKKLDQLLKKEK